MVKKTPPVEPASAQTTQEPPVQSAQQPDPASLSGAVEAAQQLAAVEGSLAVKHPALKVRSSLPSRRRANRQFGQTPVTIEANTLTEDEIRALASDPYLKLEPAESAD